jgi:ATP-dependent DNA helicase DinG
VLFFREGPASKAKNFEFRPTKRWQLASAQALEEEQHLIVEAGTGVGKSLGYLVPSVLFALEQHKKAIVSTHTINLQEQLLHKDIPILKKVLPVEFEAALMKGRQNYLCPRRLERALQSEQELFTGPERSSAAVGRWAHNARWILSDLSLEPDPKAGQHEAHVCTQKTCGRSRAIASARKRSRRT